MSETRRYDGHCWETICGYLQDADAEEELRDEIGCRVGDADRLTDIIAVEMTWDQARTIDNIVRENGIPTERMDEDDD